MINALIVQPNSHSQSQQQQQQTQQEHFCNLDIINKQISNYLKDSVLIVDRKGMIQILRGSQRILKYRLKVNESIDIWKVKIKQQYLESVVGHNSMMSRIQIIPFIKSQLFINVLKILEQTLDSKFYIKLLSDVYKNCIELDNFILQDYIKPVRNQDNEFINFLYYCIYLLKLCSKNEIVEKKDNEQCQDELKIRTFNVVGLQNNILQNVNRTNQSQLSHSKEYLQMVSSDFGIRNADYFDQLLDQSLADQQTDKSQSQQNQQQQQKQNNSQQQQQNQQQYSSSKLYIPNNQTINLEQFYQNRLKIFNTLHLFYNDLKLFEYSYNQQQQHLQQLAYFQYCFSMFMDHQHSAIYADYYCREWPSIIHQYKGDQIIRNLEQFIKNPHNNQQQVQSGHQQQQEVQLDEVPADIFRWIQKTLKSSGSNNANDLKMPVMFKHTKIICKTFQTLLQNSYPSSHPLQTYHIISNPHQYNQQQQFPSFQSFNFNKLLLNFPLIYQNIFIPNYQQQRQSQQQQLYSKIKQKMNQNSSLEKLFLCLIRNKMSLEMINSYVLGIRVVFIELLKYFKTEIPYFMYQPGISKLAYQLIGRKDLYKNIKLQRLTQCNYKENQNHSRYKDIINQIIQPHSQQSHSHSPSHLSTSTSNLSISNNEIVFKLIKQLLDTTQPFLIADSQLNLQDQNNNNNNQNDNNQNDESDLEKQSKQLLKKYLISRLSTFVGNGAFVLGSVYSFVTETLKIEKICCTGLLEQQNIKISLDLKEEKNLTILEWPDFHNGVATGLKLAKNVMLINSNHLRTWILFQKPEIPQYQHAGFLLAMGLQGYLEPFLPTDVYWYLKASHEATTVGLLLGLAASRIGKYDENTHKTLCLHIPQLIPSTYDVEISILCQTAALIGLGLLFTKTSNHAMNEMFLQQINKRFEKQQNQTDGYCLAAGIGIGFINLGKGCADVSIQDLELEERLIRYIEGGKNDGSNFNKQDQNVQRQQNVERNSSIREANQINIHITAPPALMALALINLQTNNHQLQQKISIPNSFQTLENTNPNLILLKILCKNMIMWDSIYNSTDFIYNQIPQNVRFIYENKIEKVEEKYSFIYNTDEADYDIVTQVYNNIVVGAIMALGLKYSGTGDTQVKQIILDELARLKTLKVIKPELINDPQYKNGVEQYNYYKWQCCCLLALGMVMSGTCDIQTIKIIKNTINKLNSQTNYQSKNINYGFNMALNQSLGFTCLGLGSYSFEKSQLAIACLLVSIYPHFPAHPNDNKYHLQALRHFYVIAAQQTVFHSVDLTTNQAINCQLAVQFNSQNQINMTSQKRNRNAFRDEYQQQQSKMEQQQSQSKEVQIMTTPLLIQEHRKLEYLKVIDTRYYGLKINYKHFHQGKFIYVLPKQQSDTMNDKILKIIRKQQYSKQDLYFLFQGCSIKSGSTNSDLDVLDQVDQKQAELRECLKQKDDDDEQIHQNLEKIFKYFQSMDKIDIFEIYLVMFVQPRHQYDLQYLQDLLILNQFYQNQPLTKSLNIENRLYMNSFQIKKQIYEIDRDLKAKLSHLSFKNIINQNGVMLVDQITPVEIQWFYQLMILNNMPDIRKIRLLKRFETDFVSHLKEQGQMENYQVFREMMHLQMLLSCPLLEPHNLDLLD